MKRVAQHGTLATWQWFHILRWSGAFTLIELLTVIAIIGVLVGVLIPATRLVMRRARIATAQSDIANLEQAILAYTRVFGAPPPDNNAFAYGYDNHLFREMDTPNECMVWFLTREFTSDTDAATVAGVPWHAGNGWNTFQPQNAARVYARTSAGPFLQVTGKKRKDYGSVWNTSENKWVAESDGFYEMVDPWGRPYLYRAYPKRRILTITTSGTTVGNTRVYLAGACPPGGIKRPSPVIYEEPEVPRQVTISGCSATNNGKHHVINSGAESDMRSWFEFDGGEAETPTNGYITMAPLHNAKKGFDLYSVGPNGKTRGTPNTSPPPPTHFFNEFQAPYGPIYMNGENRDTASLVWGSAADGNDVAADQGGNELQNERDCDDICNWAQ